LDPNYSRIPRYTCVHVSQKQDHNLSLGVGLLARTGSPPHHVCHGHDTAQHVYSPTPSSPEEVTAHHKDRIRSLTPLSLEQAFPVLTATFASHRQHALLHAPHSCLHGSRPPLPFHCSSNATQRVPIPSSHLPLLQLDLVLRRRLHRIKHPLLHRIPGQPQHMAEVHVPQGQRRRYGVSVWRGLE
jgi:hypothetical protein